MPGIQERPAKRARLLDGDSDDSDEDGGAQLRGGDAGGFKINSEYAKRFEHNKKREELHRLEEKYKTAGQESESSSEDEEEDDAGDLATIELDNEINATLQALRSKDPRIYDKKTSFFRPIVEDGETSSSKKEKPMTLSDYHRQNLLQAANGNPEDDDELAPQTYQEEQDAIRRQIVNDMHSAAADEVLTNGDAESDDDDGFMVKKSNSAHDAIAVDQGSSKPKELNVEEADKDPEAYLNNFLAARAWVPEENSRFAHLDSDDSEDERRAEGFEEAYNMRFEDPEKANAKLMSYARDTAVFSARREEKSGRQKQREAQREAKEAMRRERQEEKKRLRKLTIEVMERKVAQIKEAAGLGAGDVVDVEEWRNVLEGEFDDDQWEAEMQRRFGDEYYAEQDALGNNDGSGDAGSGKAKKAKKPRWEDDIDINDLVPEFDVAKDGKQPVFSLSDEENDERDGTGMDGVVTNGSEGDEEHEPAMKNKSRKDLQAEARSAKRRQRMAIEELVDSTLSTDLPHSSTGANGAAAAAGRSGPSTFRYRETSPTSFGLSARDILFADDSALNTFAGLKKTHAFRDEAKKARDRKKLGKKARLREWRRDTFGNEEGYGGTFAQFVSEKAGVDVGAQQEDTVDVEGDKSSGKKRKRKSKSKGGKIPT